MPEQPVQSEPAAGTPIVIAIDGPSGSGKSSVSRGVADHLGLEYLDSGAMYRATAWYMIEQGIDLDNPDAIAASSGQFKIVSRTDPNSPDISVDGVSVAEPIRGAAVTAAVSRVSAVPEVRSRLVDLQRNAVELAVAAGHGIVVEGRDIGTVVLPDAALKIFLTADEAARAQRRAQQDEEQGRQADISNTAASLAARDRADSSRATSPLTKADDAIEVDATFRTLPEVIEAVISLIPASASGPN